MLADNLTPHIEQQNDDPMKDPIYKEFKRQAEIGRAYPKAIVWEYFDCVLKTVKDWLVATDAPPVIKELIGNALILQTIAESVGYMDDPMASNLVDVILETNQLIDNLGGSLPEYQEHPGDLELK